MAKSDQKAAHADRITALLKKELKGMETARHGASRIRKKQKELRITSFRVEDTGRDFRISFSVEGDSAKHSFLYPYGGRQT